MKTSNSSSSNNDKGISWMYQHKQMESEKDREEYLLGNKRIQGAKLEDDYDKLRKSAAPGAKFLSNNSSLANLEAAAKKLDKNDPMYSVKLAQIKKQQEKVQKEQQEAKKKKKRKRSSSSSEDDDDEKRHRREKKKRRRHYSSSEDASNSEDEKYKRRSKKHHSDERRSRHDDDKKHHKHAASTTSKQQQLSEEEIQQRLQEMEQLGKARQEAKADALRKHEHENSTEQTEKKKQQQQLGPSFLNKLAKDAYLGDKHDSLEQQLKRKKFTLQKSSSPSNN